MRFNQFYSDPVQDPLNVESKECRLAVGQIQDPIPESYKIPSTSCHKFSGQGFALYDLSLSLRDPVRLHPD